LYPNNDLSRDAFEEVLGGMARAGLVRLSDASFEKDGKTIPYRKASLTREGQSTEEGAPIDFVMKETGKPSKGKRKKKPAAVTAKPSGPVDARIERELRHWRLEEARRLGVPAFRILTDKVLRGIATERPATLDELLKIPGVGMAIVEKYGALIGRIVNGRG
jgi:superfamily II DNA helicase RecQ